MGEESRFKDFSSPTEAPKVHKSKVDKGVTPWNFKDMRQITNDHVTPQPTFNGDRRTFDFIRDNPRRIIQTKPAEVC